MSNLHTLSSIKSEEIRRISTGIYFLDMVFGDNGLKYGVDKDFEAGIPEGSVTMLVAQAGAGKSRLTIEIASNINYYGEKVLAFQLEARPSDFKGWTKNKITNPDNFYVSSERDYKKQIELIKQVKPKIAIIDSVNKYNCNYNEVSDIVDALQSCARETRTAIILVGQLDENTNGKVRGSQDWSFLPDIIVHITKSMKNEKDFIQDYFDIMKKQSFEMKIKINSQIRNGVEVLAKSKYKEYANEQRGVFLVSIPNKNRFGQTGRSCTMRHTEEGVEYYRKRLTEQEIMSMLYS